jgi:hypothetical protein
VQRRQVRELLELPLDVGVDQDRFPESRAAVDDPVRDGPDPSGYVLERGDLRGCVHVVDDRQLQARRPGVYYQD